MNESPYDQQLFSEFFDEHPQAAVWLRPIWNENGTAITDFEYTYSNAEGLKYLNLKTGNIPGLLVSQTHTLTENLRKAFFEEMVQVYTTGVRAETRIYNPALNKFAKVLRTKFRGGILTIVQDTTEENRIIKELQHEKTFTNSILDASLNGVFAAKAVRDKEGKIEDFIFLRINPAFTRLVGLTEGEVIGKRLHSVFPGTEESSAFLMHKRVCDTGVSESIQIYYKGNDLQAWYDISSVKMDDGVVVTFQDITAQKEAAEAIEQQRSLLENILEHSPAGISVTEVIRDEQGTIIDGRTIIANDIASTFIQMPRDVYLSKTVNEIDPNIIKSSLHQQSLHTLATGEPFHTQYFFEPTGRWLELSVAKMDDDHLINIFTDITSTKEAQLQLENSLQELRRSNENLEEFAYAASHDMKEPIRKVHFFTDRLKSRIENKINEEDQHLFSRIENATNRMQLLVDDLLMYSKVNRETPVDEPVDLNQKLKLVLEDLELVIREKQAMITVGKLPVVKGHRRQLQQLFTNLIGNALKYSKPGEPPRIDIRSQTLVGKDSGFPLSPEAATKTWHLIEVEDSGVGFEQRDAERIFNVFTRLHGNTEYRGTGVGLAIARKVVENHGGYIAAQGEPDKGATFRVLLPAEGES